MMASAPKLSLFLMALIKASRKGRDWITMDKRYHKNHVSINDRLNLNAYNEVENDSDKNVFSRLKNVMINARIILLKWKLISLLNSNGN